MICDNIDLLKKATEGVLTIAGNDVRVLDEKCLRETLIDDLIRTAVFAPRRGDAGGRPLADPTVGGSDGRPVRFDPGTLRSDGTGGSVRLYGAGNQYPRADV